jgi:hypothetical protein
MFNPADHYWRDDEGSIFSSRAMKVVSSADEEYCGWLANGGVVTVWPRDDNDEQTDNALQAVLAPYGLFLTGNLGLAAVKFELKNRVDELAELERLKYITGGAGQALTYMQKSDEARRCLAEDDPDPIDYPLLSSEVGVTAPNLNGVATVVSNAYKQWQQVGAAIESVRLGSKALIDAAETEMEARTVIGNISWPSG